MCVRMRGMMGDALEDMGIVCAGLRPKGWRTDDHRRRLVEVDFRVARTTRFDVGQSCDSGNCFV